MDLDARLRQLFLNALVPSGWSVRSVNAINDDGVLAAYVQYNGGAEQVVELIPTIPATRDTETRDNWAAAVKHTVSRPPKLRLQLRFFHFNPSFL